MVKKKPAEKSQAVQKISPTERGIALAFAGVVLVTLIVLVLNPQSIQSEALAIIRFLAAIFAGIAGYLFSGNLEIEAKIPLNNTQIRAAGAFAAFIIVLLLFFYGVPDSIQTQGSSK